MLQLCLSMDQNVIIVSQNNETSNSHAGAFVEPNGIMQYWKRPNEFTKVV